MNNLKEHFNHELATKEIPYKDLADEETRNIWFEQFCDTSKIPSFWLYRLQYYSDDEVATIIKKNNERIPLKKSDSVVMADFYRPTDEYNKLSDIHTEFRKLKNIKHEFYINDITQAFITKALYKISETRDIFLDSIYDDSTDRYKEPKETAEAIIPLLEQFPLSFASAIIKDIEEDDSDMIVFIINRYNDRELDRATENKLKKMNNSLVQHLKDWIQSKSEYQEQNPTPKRKHFSKYLQIKEKGENIIISNIRQYRKWENKKIGAIGLTDFECYFCALSEDFSKRNFKEDKTLCSNLTAYLIRHWNEKVEIIFENYYKKELEKYCEKIENKFRERELIEEDFYKQHIEYEKLKAKENIIFDYLPNSISKALKTGTSRYFEHIQELPKPKNNETQKEKYNESTEKKYPAKYYALLHWIKIELGLEVPFELNSEGRYSKESIREFARNKYPNTSNQQFYKEFKDLDITNKAYIATIFGRDYKEILIKISGNNAKIIRHLKDFPN